MRLTLHENMWLGQVVLRVSAQIKGPGPKLLVTKGGCSTTSRDKEH